MCVRKKVPELGQETQLSLSTGVLHKDTGAAVANRAGTGGQGEREPSSKCLFCICQAKDEGKKQQMIDNSHSSILNTQEWFG